MQNSKMDEYLQAICEKTYTSSVTICMCYDHNLVSSLHETLRELVNMTFHSSHIRKEEIRHHAETKPQEWDAAK